MAILDNDPRSGSPEDDQVHLAKRRDLLKEMWGLCKGSTGESSDGEYEDDYESEGALSESDDRQGGPPFSPDRRGALFSHAHDWLRRGQATVTRGLGAGRRTAVQRTEQSRLLPT